MVSHHNGCQVGPLRFGLKLRLLAGAAVVSGALGAIAEGAIAETLPLKSQLIAQDVFQGLPPPPELTPLPSVTVPSDPSAAPAAAPREIEFSAPLPTTAPSLSPATPAGLPGRYFVLISGDSDLLLGQVRRVEPEAFRKTYKGRTVIQAGTFNSRENAAQRAAQLQAQGIRSNLISVSGDGGEDFGSVAQGYYVVIPADRALLPSIAETVRRAGVSGQVLQRTAPLGPHVAVGPFGDRDAAERSMNALKGIGLPNARVYFDR